MDWKNRARLILLFFPLFLLMACNPKTNQVQITPTDYSQALVTSQSLTLTPTPISTPTVSPSVTPCLDVLATPINTPLPWPYSGRWDSIAISVLPVQDLKCASQEEVVRHLVLNWLEIIKTNSTQSICGLEDYSIVQIITKINTISPQYDIVAGVTYRVRPGRFVECGWISDRGIMEPNGWIKTSDTFGVYRESDSFRLVVLSGWGT
jgi:hypothetical protein